LGVGAFTELQPAGAFVLPVLDETLEDCACEALAFEAEPAACEPPQAARAVLTPPTASRMKTRLAQNRSAGTRQA
jgi:hypothetical protein